MSEYTKPLPQITPLSKPFYDAARKHKLIIQRCKDCSQYVFYPKHFCPYCLSDKLDWVESSGKGKIYSFTVCRSKILVELDTGYKKVKRGQSQSTTSLMGNRSLGNWLRGESSAG